MSTHTAVITGSTAGLGAAFARQLAAQGYGLVLVARDGERLHDQAQTLNRQYGVPVSVIIADLVTDDGVGAVQERLADPIHPVHLLVNNAGHGLATEFVESDLDEERDLLRLHVQTPMELTHTAARGMVRRRAGRIINVASVAGFAPTGTYSAAKSWVINFSKSLHQQLRGDGVTVTALCPGLVRTEFHERSGISIKGAKKWMWLEADEVVRQGLAASAQGSAVSVPSRSYQMLTTSMRFMPDSMVKWAVNRRMGVPGQGEEEAEEQQDSRQAPPPPPSSPGAQRPEGKRPSAPRPMPKPKTGEDPDDDGTAEPTTGAIRTVNAYKAAKVTYPKPDNAQSAQEGRGDQQPGAEPEATTDEITTVRPQDTRGRGASAGPETGSAQPGAEEISPGAPEDAGSAHEGADGEASGSQKSSGEETAAEAPAAWDSKGEEPAGSTPAGEKGAEHESSEAASSPDGGDVAAGEDSGTGAPAGDVPSEVAEESSGETPAAAEASGTPDDGAETGSEAEKPEEASTPGEAAEPEGSEPSEQSPEAQDQPAEEPAAEELGEESDPEAVTASVQTVPSGKKGKNPLKK